MYKKVIYGGNETGVLIVEENTFIPFDPANTSYQKYLAWLTEGNEPEPADEPETTE